MSQSDDRMTLTLRQFVFFHRTMLIPADTSLSIHFDCKVCPAEHTGYMVINVVLMHQNFPGPQISEKLVWDITREDRHLWHLPQEKLEKLTGDRYDVRMRRQKAKIIAWYMHRIEKVEPMLNKLILQMFLDSRITADKIEMFVQEKYRPQGGAEMVTRIPWDDDEDERF